MERKTETPTIDFSSLTPQRIMHLPDDVFQNMAAKVIEVQRADRKENQILYYQPASERAMQVHLSNAKFTGISGGNRSSKTETILAELTALSTGMFPIKLHDLMMDKFRGPINVRIVIESFKTVLHPIMLPKLQWWKWSGADEPGGDRGHWGWVPRTCLIDGSWLKSWSEKNAMLTILCRDPDDTDKVIGESTIQFMSKDQDHSDFASGTFHHIMHDEPPLYAQWRENESRTMEVGGRMYLTFTWPEDPTIPCDWIFDEVYEKAQEPNKSPHHDWFELWTTENVNLNQESVAQQMGEWSEETKRVRIYGGNMRFSNLVHPLFTDRDDFWCFNCKMPTTISDDKCVVCSSHSHSQFNHVQDFEWNNKFPCIFLLDPHPRKPHMYLWAGIDGNDDIWIVTDDECEGDPVETAKAVLDTEEHFGLYVPLRIMDPNMGLSPSSTKRGVNWQLSFREAGIDCELADDSGVGRKTINEYLKPDECTLRPRLTIHSRCHNTIYQMKRYVWDDYKISQERDQKQKAKEKDNDYPTLIKYLVNWRPAFTDLTSAAQIIRPSGKRKGAY